MTVLISRRDLLKRAGMIGMTAAAPADAVASAVSLSAQAAAAPAARYVPQHLTAAESDILNAIVARLIPADASGPGAAEAGAAQYIDRALGGALASSQPAYRAGLEAQGLTCRELDGVHACALPRAPE